MESEFNLFHNALDRPEPDRAEFLKAACGDDDGLMANVAAPLVSREMRLGIPPKSKKLLPSGERRGCPEEAG